ncbi:MAG: hypothetical protein NTW93_02955 [Phycisphaerae bacterium]|nr:hypothetical protein [Phycisphaerae bacterium]
MSEQRKRVLTDEEIGRNYNLPRNGVFRAYEPAFLILFEEFDGRPREKYQANWYVGKRWDRRQQRYMPKEDAEKRLLSFIIEKGKGRRHLRLIYGHAGCGKTTFLNFFFSVYLPREYPDVCKNLTPIIIDCATASVSASMLEQDVDHRINDYFTKNRRYNWLEEDPHYLNMWEEECDFDKLFYMEMWSDLTPAATKIEKLKHIKPFRDDIHNFNRVRINYLIKHGQEPIIIWDNLDHASMEVQRRAIQLARHKLSWMPGAKIIIAVREHTYPIVQQEIAPAAYLLSDQELFAPDACSVLKQRVDTAVEKLPSTPTPPVINLTERTSVALSKPDRFLNVMLESLTEQDAKETLCDMSSDNVRIQLAMAKLAFRSGHIPMKVIYDMISSYDGNNFQVKLSWRRFMESLICGDYCFHREYGEDQSLVVNIFESGDIEHEFCNSLCMPRILSILNSFHYELPLTRVLKVLKICGYPEMTLRRSMDILMSSSLIHSPQGQLPEDFIEKGQLEIPFYVSCTPAGKYYIQKFIKELVYIEHMSVTTSLEENFRKKVELWEPKEIEKSAKSAAALIGQIHQDEIREYKYIHKRKQSLRIGEVLGFGKLSHEIAIGCQKGVEIIKKTWEEREEGNNINWDTIKDVLRPPLKVTFGSVAMMEDAEEI